MGDVTQFHIDDVSAICRVPISIDRRDDILINGLGMSKISTGNPIKLPQYAALADCEDQLTSIEINQYALKDIIHVQGVAGRMLKPPFHFAAGWIYGYGRDGVKRRILARHVACKGGNRRLWRTRTG